MDGWRIMEYDRLWTDIKGYWRKGHVEKLRCVEGKLLYSGPILDERLSEKIMKSGRQYQGSLGSFGYPLCSEPGYLVGRVTRR
jgi:hypothetical protein